MLRRLSSSGRDDHGSDALARLVNHKISSTERSMDHLHEDLLGVLRKTGRVREKNDALAERLRTICETESPSVRGALSAVSLAIYELQDHRQAMIERVEEQVLQPLKLYDQHCKHLRTELKSREHIKDKEEHKKKQLEKTQTREATNRQKIASLRVDLAGAETELHHANKALLDNLETFEQRKLSDMKQAWREFLLSEMNVAARTLEIYTRALNATEAINEHEDMTDLLQQVRVALGTSAAPAPTVVQTGAPLPQ